jgi:hypothetical protein
VQAEILPHLDALRATRDALAERRGGGGAHVARPGGRLPVDVAERREPPRVRPVVPVEVRFQLRAPPAVEVHDRAQVARLHQGEEVVDVGNGPRIRIVADPR